MGQAGSLWSLAGIGKNQKTAAGLGCVMASGVRIGLEDNLWEDNHSTPATNLGLVRRLANLADAYGRLVAESREVRQRLGLVCKD